MHRSVAVDARPHAGGLLGPQSLHLVDEVLQHQQRPAARHELVKLVLGTVNNFHIDAHQDTFIIQKL